MITELILVALTFFAIWRTHHLREFHHIYIGLIVSVLGIFYGPVLTIAGWVITADDGAEHWCEWMPPSPLHYLYSQVLKRVPLLGKLAQWLDGLFGGGASSAPPA